MQTLVGIRNGLIAIVIVLAFVILLQGCATTKKGRFLQNTGGSALAGAIYGQTRSEQKDQNSLLYSSVFGLVGAVASVVLDETDTEIKKLSDDNSDLKAQLAKFENSKIIVNTPATFNSKIPGRYKKLIDPGEWKVTETDLWIEDGENRLFHQDKVMELTPPMLRPSQTGEK